MKKSLLVFSILFSSAVALAALREGPFNFRGNSYFSNGQGAYCVKSQFDSRLPQLTPWEAQELRRMNFNGQCDDGFAEGPFNFRGRSYYANNQGAYCEFRYFDNRLKEMSYAEAQTIFNGRFDGYCQ